MHYMGRNECYENDWDAIKYMMGNDKTCKMNKA